MNGYCIKNKTNFKVEIKINGERMFIEPKEEKRILGDITIETEFPDKLEIKHISECKEKSKEKDEKSVSEKNKEKLKEKDEKPKRKYRNVKSKQLKSEDSKPKESNSEKEEK